MTLIFDHTLEGHHLEYIHHLYMDAATMKSDKVIIAVPEMEWKSLSGKFHWPESSNISFILLSQEDCDRLKELNLFQLSWKLSKLVNKTVRESGANSVFMIAIAAVIPVLPFLLPKNVLLNGIVYKIYLRGKYGRIKKWFERIRYSVMANHPNMGKVYILNDKRSTEQLNYIYKSNRFISLPDPVPIVDKSNLMNLRDTFGINHDTKIFLHFGAMDIRKGTLEILKALNELPSPLANKAFFIFAGKVSKQISKEFYDLIVKVQEKGIKVQVEDNFVGYDRLNDLCFTTDYILAPYLLTELSSGVIGYGAVFGKPVIGPGNGLIGDLIKDNSLGLTLDIINKESILEILKKLIQDSDYKSMGLRYAETNTIKAFVGTINSRI